MSEQIKQFWMCQGNPPQFNWVDYQPLIAQVVRELQHNRQTITAAESLSAGLFQATLATIPGASQVFAGGFVTYSLAMKAQLLAIDADLLEHYGVVSAWTAEQMAQNSAQIIGSDWGVGLTGVAGPDLLEQQQPGTVYLGVKSPKDVQVQRFGFQGTRQVIRQKSVIAAFIMILNQL